MKHLTRLSVAPVLLGVWLSFPVASAEPPPNQISDAEKAAGWRLLFDGKSFEGWQVAGRQQAPTQGWVIEDGVLKKQQGLRGGNLVTVEAFADFEFAWTWRLPERGNNGVKFFVLPERGFVGHEYQMWNEERGGTGKDSTGSFYDVLPPNSDRKPFKTQEWNHSRVLVQANHVEHWLNGQKILEYELGSPEVLAAVQNSKFRTTRDFGKKVRGRIMLTDHGDAAWFKDVKIRELSP